MISQKNLKTVSFGDIKLSGYEDEYVLSCIEQAGGFYEQELLDKWVLPLKGKAQVVYDIGANLGNHTVYFAKRLEAKEIYSFEPLKMNYEILSLNLAQNNIKTVVPYNFALGEKADTAFMEIAKENNNGSAKIISDTDTPVLDDAFEVHIKSADSLGLPLPDFIKIDVEGFELGVLKGMRSVLKEAIADVWIEVALETAAEVCGIMLEAGYSIKDFDLKGSNVLFSKKCDDRYADIFAAMLRETAGRRNNWIALGKEKSKFEYEQKKALELKEELGKRTSQFAYEQKKAAELKAELEKRTSQFEHEQKKASELKAELEKRTSQFEHEQKKAEQLRKKCTEYENKFNMYSKSKLFRLMLFSWKVNTNLRYKTKHNIYKLGHWAYVKLMPYPKIRRVFSSVNARLGVFKDTNKVISYGSAQKPALANVKAANKAGLKKPSRMNVAMIVDEFTYNSFRFECNALPVEPSNWKEVFENNDIDLFFCESAWSGTDPVRRPWKGQVYCSVNFKKENRNTLLEILAYCKEKGIPTAFWNKEDPTHYPDKVHNFVDTAIKFDHVFTTDKGCVQRYKEDYGHKSVHLLMFATQPRLFNPIEKFDRTEEIIFAGSWYNQHPIRCEEMGGILDRILQSEYPLKIYNRHSKANDPNHFFPERFKPYLNESLPHDKMEIAYKSSKYALNINTVTDSDTMFARRVFELMSSNTLVLSNYSKGMEELFGKDVIFVDGKHEMQIDDNEARRERCLYNVLKHHTYKQRFRQILSDAGIAFANDAEDVTLIFKIETLHDAEKAYAKFEDIAYSHKKAIFYLSEKCSEKDLRDIVVQYNGKYISVISESYCKKYEDILKLDTKYFMFADENLENGFVSKAVYHFEYLDDNVGITGRNSTFKFIESKDLKNVMFSQKMFDEIKSAENNDCVFRVYLI